MHLDCAGDESVLLEKMQVCQLHLVPAWTSPWASTNIRARCASLTVEL